MLRGQEKTSFSLKYLLSERSICLGEKAENLREDVDFINVAPGLIR